MGSGTGIRRWLSVWAAVAACGCVLSGAAPAAADTRIEVNTTLSVSPSGDGLCSLSEAVDWADGGSDPDCSGATASGTTTIDLPAGKYVVTQTLKLSSATDVVGAGASTTDIDGGGLVQVIYVWPAGKVQLSDLEVSHGYSAPLVPCVIICSTTPGDDGGGIYNDGALQLEHAVVTGSVAAPGTTGSSIFCITFGCTGDAGGAGGDGGGIYNTGTLTVSDSTISGNTAGQGSAGGGGVTASAGGAGEPGGDGGVGGAGGGVYNAGGTVSISDSTISGNSAGAGGVGGSGSTATQTGTTGGDAGSGGAGGSGGGLASEGGSVTIVDSTFLANRAGAGAAAGSAGAGDGAGGGAAGTVGDGGPSGGLDFSGTGGETLTLTDDTFNGNQAGAATTPQDVFTGGVAGAMGLRGTADLTNLTVAGNSSPSIGGAIYVIPGSTVTERNSIIATNSASSFVNCAGAAIADGGHNIDFADADNGCPGTSADPKLQAPADNGGPTQTMRLGAASAAIDAVPVSACSVATDQRGVARPQGSACDAGAYEVGPPDLAALTASASGPQSATVDGKVTPNFMDTKVSVRYGRTTAYGSTTAGTDLGAGSAAAPLAVGLSGLQPSTTYHVQVVATNADGTASSTDLTLTTAAAMTASLGRATIKGDAVSVKLACATGASGCAGALRLSSRVTTQAGRVVAVTAAAAHGRTRKPRRRTLVRTVGGGRYTLVAGQTKVVRLSLNGTGRRLLKARRRLPTLLTSSGAAQIRRRVTFIYRPSRAKRH